MDYPGFHLKLGEQLKLRGIPVYLYVAPQLWAWGKGRAKTLGKKVDHILGVLPFEQSFFESFHVPFTYVGSPIIDRVKGFTSPQKEKHIGFFPGSRNDEFKYIFPEMIQIIKDLEKETSFDFKIQIAPTLNKKMVDNEVVNQLSKNKINQNLSQRIIFSYENSLNLMNKVQYAVVTSGTASLECALSKTPMSVIYKTSPINYWIASKLIKLPYFALPNLISEKKIVPEFLQKFKNKEISSTILQGLTEQGRKNYQENFNFLESKLKGNAALNVAKKILNLT